MSKWIKNAATRKDATLCAAAFDQRIPRRNSPELRLKSFKLTFLCQI
ncbi:hypothetical protein HOLDEFILI_01250 [Holdemania filiformis DSM 12042]|uniref:Uncharacterized protein n=1 Tax=Holdemania filiformis DSM 12042 TaxID=545696 RepID=B9Y615_9FIRM|nr:hypothetical protein HOLDEFILI_01250 [Holdemania filiformis DSM 12042]